MPQSAILGSKVAISCPHGAIGTVVSGSGNVMTTNSPSARLGDAVICDCCGCPGNIVSGSPNVLVNNRPCARVTDATTGLCCPGFECCPHGRSGAIIAGAPTVMVN